MQEVGKHQRFGLRPLPPSPDSTLTSPATLSHGPTILPFQLLLMPILGFLCSSFFNYFSLFSHVKCNLSVDIKRTYRNQASSLPLHHAI